MVFLSHKAKLMVPTVIAAFCRGTLRGRPIINHNDNPLILLGGIYGILKDEKGKVKIHNRLYEQRIYNYMVSKLETSGKAKFKFIAAWV